MWSGASSLPRTDPVVTEAVPPLGAGVDVVAGVDELGDAAVVDDVVAPGLDELDLDDVGALALDELELEELEPHAAITGTSTAAVSRADPRPTRRPLERSCVHVELRLIHFDLTLIHFELRLIIPLRLTIPLRIGSRHTVSASLLGREHRRTPSAGRILSGRRSAGRRIRRRCG